MKTGTNKEKIFSTLQTEIGKESLSKIQVEDGQTVSDAVAMVVGNLGENMAARRGLTLQHSGDVVLGTYIHAAGGKIYLIFIYMSVYILGLCSIAGTSSARESIMIDAHHLLTSSGELDTPPPPP